MMDLSHIPRAKRRALAAAFRNAAEVADLAHDFATYDRRLRYAEQLEAMIASDEMEPHVPQDAPKHAPDVHHFVFAPCGLDLIRRANPRSTR